MQAAEQKAFEAEKKLSETRLQLQESEQKAVAAEERAMTAERNRQLAEERAEQAEQAVELSRKRAEFMEENIAELERKLFETETDLEELLEYREMVQDTRLMSLESATAQQELCHSSNGSLKILTHSCNNSLNGFFISGEHQQEVASLNEERQQCAGDQLSITSL